MNRRGFLTSILAAAAAPSIVRADSLMRIIVPSRELVIPQLWMADRIGGYYYSIDLCKQLIEAQERRMPHSFVWDAVPLLKGT